MKKFKYGVVIVLIIVTMVALKLYQRYNRQQYMKPNTTINTDQIFKNQHKRDSIKRVKEDSIYRQKYRSKQDSLQKEIAKKRAKTDSILKALQKQK
ncbi:MAG: hypothetical protein HWD82_03175 [Flavobacteriaceae bacterium]|nr:hypothetical protein [Flavobacteriaceae bacterium]